MMALPITLALMAAPALFFPGADDSVPEPLLPPLHEARPAPTRPVLRPQYRHVPNRAEGDLERKTSTRTRRQPFQVPYKAQGPLTFDGGKP